MKKLLLLLVLFIVSTSFSQDMEKDTIRLNKISLSTKKPKLKKIKIGKGTGSNPYKHFHKEYPFYLVEDFPKGTIKEITFFFIGASISDTVGASFARPDVLRTEYELTLYEVSIDNKIGRKINKEPIPVIFEEHKNNKKKKIRIDVSAYNITSNRFFVYFNPLTSPDCKECFYSIPLLSRDVRKELIFYKNKEDITVKEIQQKSIQNSHARLCMEIKTLTSDY